MIGKICRHIIIGVFLLCFALLFSACKLEAVHIQSARFDRNSVSEELFLLPARVFTYEFSEKATYSIDLILETYEESGVMKSAETICEGLTIYGDRFSVGYSSNLNEEMNIDSFNIAFSGGLKYVSADGNYCGALIVDNIAEVRKCLIEDYICLFTIKLTEAGMSENIIEYRVIAKISYI